MALNSETDGIVSLLPGPERSNGERLEITAAGSATPIVDEEVPVIAPALLHEGDERPLLGPPGSPARAAGRRRWLIPAAAVAAGLIVSATLGGLLWSTNNQRDALRHQLASTQATLSATQARLSGAQADAAARKLTADYVSVYIVDSGRVLTDYETLVACNAYTDCRTAAQQALSDMQAFQSDRASVTVPPALANADGMLGDGLSAAIAADQELITGMDDNDLAKLKDAGHKFDEAMLSFSKAEAALGAGLK